MQTLSVSIHSYQKTMKNILVPKFAFIFISLTHPAPAVSMLENSVLENRHLMRRLPIYIIPCMMRNVYITVVMFKIVSKQNRNFNFCH